MGTLHGIIRDSVSGAQLEAKVHILNSTGQFVHPGNTVLKGCLRQVQSMSN